MCYTQKQMKEMNSKIRELKSKITKSKVEVYRYDVGNDFYYEIMKSSCYTEENPYYDFYLCNKNCNDKYNVMTTICDSVPKSFASRIFFNLEEEIALFKKRNPDYDDLFCDEENWGYYIKRMANELEKG
ncbi:MAG: hypothetical protein PUB43_02070 [Oscillospiraceae bacterium]|nr:hypothetical protein [Oscillospiraceae bacterium]